MFTLKRLNARGVAHHAVLMLIIVVAVASFGAYTVLKSNADALNTADYTVKASSEDGCWLAGRSWENGSCSQDCRAKGTTYDYNGTNPGFCSGQVTQNTDADTCVQTLHRMYVQDVGCSRMNAQDSANNSQHCTGWTGNSQYKNASGGTIPVSSYPNYVTDYSGSTDKCIAATVAAPQPVAQPSGGFNGNTTTSTNTDQISDASCKLLGRTGSNGTCNRVCSDSSQTLLVTADSVYYCSQSVANLTPANCSATFRVYVAVNGHNVGCAKRSPQISASDSLRCQTNAGYTYYVAIPGGTDYCTKSSQSIVCTGPIVALNTTAAGKILCPGGTTTSSGGIKGGTTGGTSGGNDPITGLPLPGFPSSGTVTSSAPQAAQGKAVKVENIKQTLCTDLLGRDWIPADKKNKQAAGCSEDSCQKSDKIDIHKNNGSYFCDGYATTALTSDTCTNNLHRQWLGIVDACASLPNQNDKPGTRHIKAAQCVDAYTTYIYRTAQYDECLKPGTVDNLKNVARISGIPFVKATTLSKAGLCNVLPHKHWNGSRCVQDRPIQTSSSTSSSSTTGSTGTTGTTSSGSSGSTNNPPSTGPVSYQQVSCSTYNAHVNPDLRCTSIYNDPAYSVPRCEVKTSTVSYGVNAKLSGFSSAVNGIRYDAYYCPA